MIVPDREFTIGVSELEIWVSHVEIYIVNGKDVLKKVLLDDVWGAAVWHGVGSQNVAVVVHDLKACTSIDIPLRGLGLILFGRLALPPALDAGAVR